MVSTFSPIELEKLTLKPFISGDAGKYFLMSQEASIRKWLPDLVCRNKHEAEEILNSLIVAYTKPGHPAKGPFVWGVRLNESKELIGHVGVSPVLDTVEIGYAIESRYQGKGYGTAAVSVFVEWGLDTFGLSEILGIVDRSNVGACRVLEESGFHLMDEYADTRREQERLIRKYTLSLC